MNSQAFSSCIVCHFPDYSFHGHLHIEIRPQNDDLCSREHLLIIYIWWPYKTCWYQLVHTVNYSVESDENYCCSFSNWWSGGQGTSPFWALIDVCHLTGCIERLSPGHNITLCGQIHILNRISRVVDLARNDQIFLKDESNRGIYSLFLSSYTCQITLLILIVNIFIIIYNNIQYHIFFSIHIHTCPHLCVWGCIYMLYISVGWASKWQPILGTEHSRLPLFLVFAARRILLPSGQLWFVPSRFHPCLTNLPTVKRPFHVAWFCSRVSVLDNICYRQGVIWFHVNVL